MADIIDLTVSPQPEIIEISSDQGNTSPGRHARAQENDQRRRKKRRSNGVSASAQPSRTHSPEIADKSSLGLDACIPHPKPVSNTRERPSPTAGESELFFVDGAAAPLVVEDSPPPEPVVPGHDSNELLLPSHVTVFHDNGPTPARVIPPPGPSSDDDVYIEYLEYEDRKAPGLVRYFEIEGEGSSQSRPSVFKCKNCGAEGEHKTYECPVQICLTCGARDEHSTRSCPISKTCYTCGMRGHINKTCPNRFSAHATPDLHGNCDRCGSAKHNMNECPTLWRIYQYVNDEERILIMRNREQKKKIAIGEGGEGYIGRVMWCYNCANTGHLGDDCNELPHPATFPMEHSAFGSHNVTSGPFYDPDTELVSTGRGERERDGDVDRPHLADDWDAGAPVDVGKRGKNRDRERLEKRFREQEDKSEDWFDGIRNSKKRGVDQQAPSSAPGGRRLRFGLLKDGGLERPSSPAPLPPNGSGLSLLARLSDTRGEKTRGKVDRGRDRHEPPHQLENSIRIRGAATEQRKRADGHTDSQRTGWEQGQASQDRWKRDRPAGLHRESGPGHGPRYSGGYDR